MILRNSTVEAAGICLSDYIEMKSGERTPTSRFVESGVFKFEGHTYCIIGSTGQGCDLRIQPMFVALFNLKSQTIRQVRRDSIVIPVGAEIVIIEETPIANRPRVR